MSSGTRIKTRKRNIAAPLDPAAFADAVVQIYLDNAGDLVIVTGATIILLTMYVNMYVVLLSILAVPNCNCYVQELIAKSIESSDLNFQRYGDTFFEASFLTLYKFLLNFCYRKKLILKSGFLDLYYNL